MTDMVSPTWEMTMTAMDSQEEPEDQPADASDDHSDRLQQLLVQAGNLTGSEARVMVALLGLRTGTLRQLNEATEINRSNLYPVLEALSAKGVCQRLPGKQAVWECPEPTEVMARLRAAEQARLQAAVEVVERGFDEAEAILTSTAPSTEDSPITVDDDARIGALYLEAMASVEAEVLVLNRGPYPGDLRPNSTVLEALARGARARALYVAAELDAPDGQLRMCADAYAQAGVDQRVVDSLPVSMAVVGEEMALLALPGRDSLPAVPGHAAAVRHEGMVELLCEAFERIWDRARPYQPADPVSTGLRVVEPDQAVEAEPDR